MKTAWLVIGISLVLPSTFARADHPLDPIIAAAEKAYRHLKSNVRNYTCVFHKREQINGQLRPAERMYCKIRHASPQSQEPFGVYVYYLAPQKNKGRQVLFVDGENGNKMLVREARGLQKVLGVVSLSPQSRLAMANSRYPVTEIGIKNLSKKIVQTLRKELAVGGTEVRRREGGHVGGRPCICYEIRHPKRMPQFQAHMARIYFDREHGVPIRYEAFGWPTKAGQNPP